VRPSFVSDPNAVIVRKGMQVHNDRFKDAQPCLGQYSDLLPLADTFTG
jgi:hypothetical protein